MKKVKFLKYLNHAELTGGEQRKPDEVVECADKVAEQLVATQHAEYVLEPERPKDKPVVPENKTKTGEG